MVLILGLILDLIRGSVLLLVYAKVLIPASASIIKTHLISSLPSHCVLSHCLPGSSLAIPLRHISLHPRIIASYLIASLLLFTSCGNNKQCIYFTIYQPFAAALTYLQSKFTMLEQGKDYGLLVGKIAKYVQPRLNIANLIAKARFRLFPAIVLSAACFTSNSSLYPLYALLSLVLICACFMKSLSLSPLISTCLHLSPLIFTCIHLYSLVSFIWCYSS